MKLPVGVVLNVPPPPTPGSRHLATAMGAAQALGVPVARIAKSVALLAGAQPWLAVIRGDARLDLHKVWGWCSLPPILGRAATTECLYPDTHCKNHG